MVPHSGPLRSRARTPPTAPPSGALRTASCRCPRPLPLPPPSSPPCAPAPAQLRARRCEARELLAGARGHAQGEEAVPGGPGARWVAGRESRVCFESHPRVCARGMGGSWAGELYTAKGAAWWAAGPACALQAWHAPSPSLPAHTLAHTYARTHTCTHACTQVRMTVRTHAHTCTHVHTQQYTLLPRATFSRAAVRWRDRGVHIKYDQKPDDFRGTVRYSRCVEVCTRGAQLPGWDMVGCGAVHLPGALPGWCLACTLVLACSAPTTHTLTPAPSTPPPMQRARAPRAVAQSARRPGEPGLHAHVPAQGAAAVAGLPGGQQGLLGGCSSVDCRF